MGEVKDMLLKAYLKNGARPPDIRPVDKKIDPELSGIKPPKPIPVEKPRTLGDITTAMMAQKIYNPGAPPAPKSPSKAMQNTGTTDAMSLDGPWGRPQDK
jgi:hypothetical protein